MSDALIGAFGVAAGGGLSLYAALFDLEVPFVIRWSLPVSFAFGIVAVLAGLYEIALGLTFCWIAAMTVDIVLTKGTRRSRPGRRKSRERRD